MSRPGAPATRGLLIVIGLGFAAEVLMGGSNSTEVLIRLGANVPPLVWEGQWWRLVTCMFLHIGLMHLLFNSWALYQLGSLYEVWMGSSRLLWVYFGGGVVGSLASLFFTRGLSAGASGAIFAVLGALIAVLVRRRDRLRPEAKSLLMQLVIWAAINVFLGLSVPGIDNAAHLGGFVGGLFLGFRARTRRERSILRSPI